jgi:hypothetical protein
MDKVIVYVKHDRHTDDHVKVFIYSSENEEKVKKLCQDDWGSDAHKVGYEGDYGYGYNEDYFSYYHIITVKENV